MDQIERGIEQIARWALMCGVALVVFDVALIMCDVLGRYLFARSLIGTVEIARNTVPLIVFCQAPATILAGRMLRVSALFSQLPHGAQTLIELLSCALGMTLFVALIADMSGPLLHSWQIWEEDGMAGVKLPLAPIRSFLFALWIIAVFAIAVVMRRVWRGFSPQPTFNGH